MTYKIMIVDDEPANLRLLERLFRKDYTVITAASGLEALRLLEQHEVALIITDQRMPQMTGIELLMQTAELRPHMVRIIITGYTDVSALIEAINWGQVYKYVSKPWSNEDLQQTVSRAIEHYEANKSRHELELINERLGRRVKELSQGFVRAIADALEAKDEHVHGHGRRVSGYSAAIGRRLGLDAPFLEQLSLAGFLHDLGKIGTPDDILLKPGPLNTEEREMMQLHSERGARMLASVPEMSDLAEVVRHHHENLDGTGYPEGLKGEQIPLAARIIAVADAYDAMTSPRPFREASSHEAAILRLQALAGTRFDPAIVQAFSSLEAIAKIRKTIAGGFDCLGLFGPLSMDVLEKLTLNELMLTVESEPGLAAKVLREVNAGASGNTVTANVQVACIRLGEPLLRTLIVLSQESAFPAALPPELRNHAIRSATAARLIADLTQVMDPDDAFTLGLLHDVGSMLLYTLFPDQTEEMLRLDEEHRCEREVAEFGVDHAQVGQWVLESCGVPRSLTAAVQSHHDVLRINAPTALLLHVANAISHADEPQKVAALDILGSDRLSLLHLSRSDLASIHQRTAAVMEQQLDLVM